MKIVNIKKYSFLVLSLLIFAFSSCDKQEEQMENRDAIVGKWNVVESVVEANPASAEVRAINEAYVVSITRSDIFADEVYIYNFFNVGFHFSVPAYVDGLKISIAEITFDSEDLTIRGEGTISSNHQTINWTYWVEDPYGDEREYKATYSFRE